METHIIDKYDYVCFSKGGQKNRTLTSNHSTPTRPHGRGELKMQIAGVSVAYPSRVVTNPNVIDMIRDASQGFEGDLEETLRRTGTLLRATGLRTRRWLAHDENAVDLTVRAAQGALEKAHGLKPTLVIYASVFPLLIEPGSSNLVAHMLGLDTAECFDVKEACDGYMKAMKIAQLFLRSGEHSCIMIVNAEFSNIENYAIRPKLYSLKTDQDLIHRFPAFTIGEAATAVVLSNEGESWKFTTKTRNDLVDLCTVTPSWQHERINGFERIGPDGAGWFTSWASTLSGNGIPLAVETFKESGIVPSDAEILFTHCSSKSDWSKIAKRIGLHNSLFDIYSEFGNVVSAGIPAAMATAESGGRLKRGSNVAVLVASAGMTFTATSFQF